MSDELRELYFGGVSEPRVFSSSVQALVREPLPSPHCPALSLTHLKEQYLRPTNFSSQIWEDINSSLTAENPGHATLRIFAKNVHPAASSLPILLLKSPWVYKTTERADLLTLTPAPLWSTDLYPGHFSARIYLRSPSLKVFQGMYTRLSLKYKIQSIATRCVSPQTLLLKPLHVTRSVLSRVSSHGDCAPGASGSLGQLAPRASLIFWVTSTGIAVHTSEAASAPREASPGRERLLRARPAGSDAAHLPAGHLRPRAPCTRVRRGSGPW